MRDTPSHLTECIRIRRHVSEDDKDMLLQLVRVVLSRCERKSRGDDTLDRRVIRKVEEQRDTVETAILFKVLLEEPRGLHVNTHCGKHDGKVVFMSIMHVLRRALDEAGLPDNLRSNLRIRHGQVLRRTTYSIH
jgi:hypothetical protein